jgi:hypothetical protein
MQIFGLKINTKDVLACPARFERATYALEEIVAVQKYMYFNNLNV